VREILFGNYRKMVRVISQGFSTPRSRHSSGEEMIDRFAAMKALGALNDDENNKQCLKNECVTKSLVMDCNTDTNDSFSGLDSDSDSRACSQAGDLQNNNIHQVTLKLIIENTLTDIILMFMTKRVYSLFLNGN
jgi:hypothetical protein